MNYYFYNILKIYINIIKRMTENRKSIYNLKNLFYNLRFFIFLIFNKIATSIIKCNL